MKKGFLNRGTEKHAAAVAAVGQQLWSAALEKHGHGFWLSRPPELSTPDYATRMVKQGGNVLASLFTVALHYSDETVRKTVLPWLRGAAAAEAQRALLLGLYPGQRGRRPGRLQRLCSRAALLCISPEELTRRHAVLLAQLWPLMMVTETGDLVTSEPCTFLCSLSCGLFSHLVLLAPLSCAP